MLDIVAADDDQLALPVEIIGVDDAQPGLPAPARAARQIEARSCQPAQNQGHQRQQRKDDGEGQDPDHAQRQLDAE